MEDFDSLNNSEYYFNRELSWLEFNNRVLDEAWDKSNPILERLNFTAITASNLDEFFMVRVASLKNQEESGFNMPGDAGLTPADQIKAISEKVHGFVNVQYNCLYRSIIPALEKESIVFLKFSDMDKTQKEFITGYYYSTIFPILTPMAIDQSRPFPLLNNKALVFLVELNDSNKEKCFAVLQVPTVIDRIIPLTESVAGVRHFIFLEDVIGYFISDLFIGYNILKYSLFRITRNSDLDIDDEDAPNLMNEIERSVKMRKWGKPVRLEVEKNINKRSFDFIKERLEVQPHEIYETKGVLDPTVFFSLYKTEGFAHLKNNPLVPIKNARFYEKNIFEAVREGDILIHHPYESFDAVIDFVKTAAADPNVLAIKQTLYRVSGNSPIVKALITAAENGKQVTAMVELKARFDEENNINWARQLERSGCHVVYGLTGLKTHCKACLIVRKEEDGIKRYVHLGTGNYNDSTAKLYTDLGFFTCKESFGRDVSSLFNVLTGYSAVDSWNKISVAPRSLRKMFIRQIESEISNAKNGKKAKIIAKMNSLVDRSMIKALYAASMAGVEVRLIVRGICCLKSGIEGISDNITVVSIIDRFLEHCRIYYFENGGDPNLYLSSADWMPRNLDRRIEIAFPVEDKRLKDELVTILDTALADTIKLRLQSSDGSYVRADKRGKPQLRSQLAFYDMSSKKAFEYIGLSMDKRASFILNDKSIEK